MIENPPPNIVVVINNQSIYNKENETGDLKRVREIRYGDNF